MLILNNIYSSYTESVLYMVLCNYLINLYEFVHCFIYNHKNNFRKYKDPASPFFLLRFFNIVTLSGKFMLSCPDNLITSKNTYGQS